MVAGAVKRVVVAIEEFSQIVIFSVLEAARTPRMAKVATKRKMNSILLRLSDKLSAVVFTKSL